MGAVVTAKQFAHHGASSGLSAKKLPQPCPSSSTSANKLAQQAQKRQNCGVFSPLGELFRAQGAARGNCETAITSATEKRAQNAYFSPAKAMAVSDNRDAWSAEPDHSARGRRLGQSAAPVGNIRYKRRQTNAIHIASRGPLLQTSSIQAQKPPFSAKKPSD